eukprot:TRINITY_DN1537_c0_g1_i1.p1 TRINITY_DN1537_c0_g1~~TRINITY_DN1537_c0_g1_i1.p1  ORF type:complete len:302 (+),score=75.70 TRINITY_DN1537_c0_g1_i1:84-989(+)
MSEEERFSSLWTAISENNVDKVKTYASRTYINRVNPEDGRTPLIFAISHQSKEIVDQLLENGADAFQEGVDGTTPLLAVIETKFDQKSKEELIKKLVIFGASLNIQGKDGTTALLFACTLRDGSSIKILVDQGADLNLAGGKENHTPLTLACWMEDALLAEMLLNRGANVNWPGNHGLTPLYIAAERGSVEMVDLLLSNGADVNTPTSTTHTSYPIHVAVEKRYKDVLARLLQAKAKITAVRNNGDFPLFIAAQNGFQNEFCILLEAGADPKQKHPSGLSCKEVAEKNGHTDIVDVINDKL